MADAVIRANRVMLNGTIFPINGFIRESSISRFPAKTILGDSEYTNEQILSNWIISSQKGGLLVEEMDESIHMDRYFWSTCETRFRSNILLPPLVTALSWAGTPIWTTATGSTAGSWATATNAHDGDTGTAATITLVNGVKSGALIFSIPSIPCDTIRYFINYSGSSTLTIDLDAYYNGQWNDVFDGAATKGAWESKALTGGEQTVTQCRIYLTQNDGSDRTGSIYEVAFQVSSTPTGNGNYMVDFNSKTYIAKGASLYAYNGTTVDILKVFSVAITDLVVSSDGYLLIYLGDDDEYWFMSTAEVFTETNVALAKWGLRWDGKTWKMAANGRWWYIVAPSVAAPSWTAGDASGGLDDYALTPKSVTVYRDAAGALIPYCATTSGLWAYDFTNSKWEETEVVLPTHDQTGLGLVVWQDAIYVSGGLSVKKYIAAGTATLTEIGLAEDDGLPQLRSGEIAKFIKGYNEFFALIDSTYEGATSRSQVMSYDGRGWRTWWEATADNKNMYSGIVTSVGKHQLLFSTTDGVYSIPLQRVGRNPKKVSGYTYAASGIHITPRFDAGTKAFAKLATKLTLFLDDMSSSETVAMTYQIDQAQGALTSAWTSLVAAQTADGQIEQTFGTNGVGIVFYDIQFRLALARGGTNTTSPIVKGMVLSYLKLLDRKRAWSFTINIAEADRVGSKPKTLFDALVTILASNTLMSFTFRGDGVSTDTVYVLIQPYAGFFPTGRDWNGTFNLTALEI